MHSFMQKSSMAGGGSASGSGAMSQSGGGGSVTDSSLYQFPFDEKVKDKIESMAQIEVRDDRNPKKVHVRTVVCEHWIYGLCQTDEVCKYLHSYDVNKMPNCKKMRNGVCKVKYCPFKHGEESSGTECIFYKQGFCYRGKDCKNQHIMRLKDECPIEASFEAQKKIKVADPNENLKVTLCSLFLVDPLFGCAFKDKCHYAHGEEDVREGQFRDVNQILDDDDIYDPTRNRLDANLSKKTLTIRLGGNIKDICLKSSVEPFNPNQPPAYDNNSNFNPRIEYFLIQAPDLPTLAKAIRLGYWQVSRKTGEDLNDAYRRSDHVLLFFSVRLMKGIYGLARLDGPVPPPIIGSDYTREFPIQWMRTFRISMRTVAQMKTAITLTSPDPQSPQATRLHIGKARGDCPIGQYYANDEDRRSDKSYHDVLRIAYRKPEWDWTLDLEKASRIKNVKILFPSEPTNSYSSSSSSSLSSSSSSSEGTESALATASSSALALIPADSDRLFSKNWEREMIKSSYEIPSNHATRRPSPKATFYKGDKGGFMCCASGAFIDEMFAKKLFGIPANQYLQFRNVIGLGIPIFVLNTDANLYGQAGNDIYGIFQAISELSNEPIDPNAFISNGKCEYTCQMRVECVVKLDYPIKHVDPDVSKVFSKIQNIGGAMPLAETVELCEIFAHRAGLIPDLSHTSGSSISSVNSMLGGMGGAYDNMFGPQSSGFPRALPRVAQAAGGDFKPPFAFSQDVPEGGIGGLDINTFMIHNIKRKILGAEKASNLRQLIQEAGGSLKNANIRIRGLNSGFQEGPMQQELQKPLFFTISADSETLLKALATRLSAAITQALIEQRGN